MAATRARSHIIAGSTCEEVYSKIRQYQISARLSQVLRSVQQKRKLTQKQYALMLNVSRSKLAHLLSRDPDRNGGISHLDLDSVLERAELSPKDVFPTQIHSSRCAFAAFLLTDFITPFKYTVTSASARAWAADDLRLRRYNYIGIDERDEETSLHSVFSGTSINELLSTLESKQSASRVYKRALDYIVLPLEEICRDLLVMFETSNDRIIDCAQIGEFIVSAANSHRRIERLIDENLTARDALNRLLADTWSDLGDVFLPKNRESIKKECLK